MLKRSNKTNEVVSFGMLVLMRRRCMGGDVCFLAAAVGAVVSGSTRNFAGAFVSLCELNKFCGIKIFGKFVIVAAGCFLIVCSDLSFVTVSTLR